MDDKQINRRSTDPFNASSASHRNKRIKKSAPKNPELGSALDPRPATPPPTTTPTADRRASSSESPATDNFMKRLGEHQANIFKMCGTYLWQQQVIAEQRAKIEELEAKLECHESRQSWNRGLGIAVEGFCALEKRSETLAKRSETLAKGLDTLAKQVKAGETAKALETLQGLEDLAKQFESTE